MTAKQWRIWGLIMAIFIAALLIPYLFVTPAHAVNGTPDTVVGVVNDNMPMDSDGIGELSDTDVFTAMNSFMSVRDASGGDSTTVGGDSVWSGGLAAHPPLIRVRTQYQVWSRDVLLTEPQAAGFDVHIQATVTTEYYFWHGWPSGGFSGNHVAPFGVDLCYAFKGGFAPSLLWGGISANIAWEDNVRFIGVEDIRTGDKGRGGCVHYKVPNSVREWFVMTQHPRWLGDGWINWKLDTDQSFHWHSAHSDDAKWLSPARDPIITTASGQVWHNIYKTW